MTKLRSLSSTQGLILFIHATAIVIFVFLGISITDSLFRYIISASSVATIISATIFVSDSSNNHQQFRQKSTVASRTALDVLLSVGIIALVITGRQTSGLDPLSNYYYGILLLVSGLLAVRYLISVSAIPLIHTILFLLSARATIWRHAPVVGTDTLFHIGIVEYMLQTAQRIPFDASYYHYFPSGHSFATIIALLLDIDAKSAWFLATGLPLSLSLIGVYIFAQRIFSTESYATLHLAAFISGVAATTHQYGAMPFAQSLAVAILPFFIWAAGFRNYRGVLLTLILFVTLITTHNLTPILATAFIGILAVVALCSVWLLSEILDDWVNGYIILAILFVISSTVYFIYSQYMGFIVGRALDVFGPSTLSASVSNPLSGEIPRTSIFGGTLPGLLAFALSPLFYGFIILLASFQVVSMVIDQDRLPIRNTLVAIGFFGFVGVIFIGGQQHGARALAEAAVVTAAVGGYQLQRVANVRKYAGPLLMVLLVLIASFSMVVNPNAAATNSTGYKPLAIQSETAGVEFVQDHSSQVNSDSWLTSYADYQLWGLGETESTLFRSSVDAALLSSSYLERYPQEYPETPFLLKSEVVEEDPPACYEVVYTSQDSMLLLPEECEPTASSSNDSSLG